MSKNIINGITIEGDYRSVVIKNGKIYLDGKLYKPEDAKGKEYVFDGPLVINGNVKNVDGTNITINGDVSGNVDGIDITIEGNVGGDVDGTNVIVKLKK